MYFQNDEDAAILLTGSENNHMKKLVRLTTVV